MRSTLSSLTAIAGRQFGSLRGGPMAVALSAEFRKEDNTYNRTDVTKARRDIEFGAGRRGTAADGRTEHLGRWTGIQLPWSSIIFIVRRAPVWYDDDSDFGSTMNLKFSV